MKGIVLAAVGALLLQGCALGLVAAGGAGGAAGAHYWQEGERTFTAPIEQVREAARQTLDGMDLTINEDSATGDGRRLVASTLTNTVRVDLENVTYNMTKMTVSVSGSDGFSRDHTAEQTILKKTGEALSASGALVGSAGGAH